eukprot:TRINITY_DN3226_c0_g1_i1.p1 TRINITY_DN3226_c0_g1~~TRINITY_DN3226_c0_g1_i1.p1  ORF type:complete len:496 (-),score=34.84 TRINITY_DN3226_c0_g1_i1:251-1681(-)
MQFVSFTSLKPGSHNIVFNKLTRTCRVFPQRQGFLQPVLSRLSQAQKCQSSKFFPSLSPNQKKILIGQNVVNAPSKQENGFIQQLLGDKYKLLSLATLALSSGAAGFMLNSTNSASSPFYTIQALALLGVIVAVHEAGHFLCARSIGVHISKFAIGFGPSLLQFKSKGVEYSLRALPLGGFVAFPDYDRDCPYPPNDPDLLKNRGIWQRALVISGGVLANFAFAFLIILAQSGTFGLVEAIREPGIRVPSVVEMSSAYKGGVRSGDLIVRVGDDPVLASPSAVNSVVNKIKSSPMKELDIVVRRGEKELNLRVTPDVREDGNGQIGVQLAANVKFAREIAHNPIRALVITTKEFSRQVEQIFNGVSQIFFNFEKSSKEVSGPIAIIATGAEVAKRDISGFFQFASLVNLNLAVVNILPLPALDGGYLLLLAIEGLRGKKLPQKVEQGVTASGFLLLMMVGIVLIVRDTFSLGSRSL